MAEASESKTTQWLTKEKPSAYSIYWKTKN
jgi:hypothetical protein